MFSLEGKLVSRPALLVNERGPFGDFAYVHMALRELGAGSN
jgi:hypothetical protein